VPPKPRGLRGNRLDGGLGERRVFLQNRLDLIGWHGCAEVEALPILTPEIAQQLGLRCIADAFGHDFEIEIPRQADNAPNDLRALIIRANLFDERMVDLQRLNREPSQVTQR